MKFNVLLPMLIGLVALGLACTVEATTTNPSTPSDKSENQNVAIKTSPSSSVQGESNTNPIVISAKDLENEHRKNHIRFKATYKGKWLEVSGTVRGIGEDLILLDEMFPSSLKLMLPQPQQPDPRMVASVGEPLTLVCLLKRSGKVPTSINLEGCHFQQ